MNSYEISYSEFVEVDGKKKLQSTRVGTVVAKNGIEAIKSLLRERLSADELKAELDTVWTGGSNKRIFFHGLTFEAKKVKA